MRRRRWWRNVVDSSQATNWASGEGIAAQPSRAPRRAGEPEMFSIENENA